MKARKLREETETELERMGETVNELRQILPTLEDREPTKLEIAGAGGFLAQFYGGIERILTRICKYHEVPVPAGPTWHRQIFALFGEPPHPDLPQVLDENLEHDLVPYRSFRHVFVHGYGILLEWEKMRPGVEQLDDVFQRFSDRIRDYLKNIESEEKDPEPGQ